MSGRMAVTARAKRQVERWAEELTGVGEFIGSRFSRSEPRRRRVGYLEGLLGSVERKNGWQRF